MTYMNMHKDILYQDGQNACDFKSGEKVIEWFRCHDNVCARGGSQRIKNRIC